MRETEKSVTKRLFRVRLDQMMPVKIKRDKL